MTTTGDNAMPEDDRVVEELLSHAAPRPLPSADAMREAKLAVRSEWQQVTARRTTMRRLTYFATAATVILGVALVVNTWLAPTVQPVTVAALDKSVGVIYLLGEESELRRAADLREVKSGQTIVTANDAGVGLSWGDGGSLRLDEKTEVRFVANDRVELKSGRIYYDSLSGDDRNSDAPLTIVTDFGDVTHIGTQFITAVGNDSLTVSVREGRVAIDGRFHAGVAEERKQITFEGSRAPETLDISGYGPDWHWIEVTAAVPVAVTKGKESLMALLEWVSRETGLDVRCENGDDECEKALRTADTLGDVSLTPRAALRQALMSNDLQPIIDEKNGVIIISQAGQ